MSGGCRPKGGSARGKSKPTRKGTAKSYEFEVFDAIYNKTGKVLVVPDVVAPKPNLFKEVRDGEYQDVHHSRRLKTAGQNAEKSIGETSLVPGSHHQSRDEEGSSPETYRESTSVDVEMCVEETSLVLGSHQQSQEKEGSSLETYKESSSGDAEQCADDNFLVAESRQQSQDNEGSSLETYQESTSGDSENRADETSLVTERQQQAQEKEESSLETYKVSSSVNAEKSVGATSLVPGSQQESQDKERSSLETNEESSSVDAKKCADEKFLVAESKKQAKDKEESSLETYQESSSVNAEKSVEETSLVPGSKQQSKDKEGSSLENYEESTSVDAEQCVEETSVIVECQQQVQENEGSSLESYKVQHRNAIELNSSKGGQKGERPAKTVHIKKLKSYIPDEEKLVDPNVQEQLRAEENECLVIENMKAVLEEVMSPDDPPVFILHNQSIDVRVKGKQRTKIAQVVLILHPTLGVLLVEVKAVKSRTSFSRFDAGTDQLLRAKDFVLEEMGDLLGEDAVVLTMALPELKPEDSTFIRQQAQELSATKQEHQDASPLSADEARGNGGAGQKCNDPKFKGTALLRDHPEIFLLCGSTADDFSRWVEWLGKQRPRSGHAFKGATKAERLDNFKRACIRRIIVPGLHPLQSVKDSADLHQRFHLTEEQLQVRDSPAEFLHISGPPGSGKTLLLAERARRWLREGRHVALAVGQPTLGLLLHFLAANVCGKIKGDIRVSLHKGCADLLDFLNLVVFDDPVSLIVDEIPPVIADKYGRLLLDHVSARRVVGLWSADTQPLPGGVEAVLQELGGSTTKLSLCLRCPQHVRDWINDRKLVDPPLPPLPVPIVRELSVGVKVICHPNNHKFQSWESCPSCKEDAKAIFSSLGLVKSCATSRLKLSDVIVITTTSSCNRDRVAEWLRRLELDAVAEKDCNPDTPVLPPTIAPAPQHQAGAAARSRILNGTDINDKPAIHVVWCEEFRGLEKPVVLLWHEDKHDMDQHAEARAMELEDTPQYRQTPHNDAWCLAATRCQGRLAVVAVTPSPLLALQQSTCPSDLSSRTHQMSLSSGAQQHSRSTQE